MEAPDAIKWLNELGVMFDKDKDGRMITTHGGGTSRKRMHACKDYSGAEIMRVLRDEVWNRQIPIADFTAAVELIKDDRGQVAGAVLQNMETGEYKVAKAKTVIIATGGAGRLHYQNFPTSNHYGATADGLVMGYRAGAPLLYQDTIQYHPTGVAYPAQIFGALVTEKVRSLGAMLINAEGEAFGKKGNDVFRKLETFPVPVIAAVNGFALGGGCEISMSCDIRICSENAVFGQPEVGLGITPGFGGTQRLARLVGAGMAKQMIYTARNIKADEALRIGLVNAVYTQEELTEKMHNYELEPSPYTVLCVDYRQSGIGSASCGPMLLEEYRLNGEKMEFSVRLKPELV